MSAVLFFDERSVQELMPDPARARDLVPSCLTAYARGTHLGSLAASPPDLGEVVSGPFGARRPSDPPGPVATSGPPTPRPA